jgi:cytidylate kinase
MIITIDGPVGTGKSTIAKKLAESLGYIFFDTGAMYRTLTYAIIKHNISLDDPQAIDSFLQSFTFNVRVQHGEKHYFLDHHEDVTDKIRSAEVNALVSRVSSIKGVRDKLVAMQRQLAQGVNAVFEGRDMGTVVFPEASIKIFLTGRLEVRAKRRYDEMICKNPVAVTSLTLEQVIEDINKRDTYDSSREISPLQPAVDSFTIDTSDLAPEEVVIQILEYKDTKKWATDNGKARVDNGKTK